MLIMSGSTAWEGCCMVNMNQEAIEYIRDKMGYEDVLLQVITYKT